MVPSVGTCISSLLVGDYVFVIIASSFLLLHTSGMILEVGTQVHRDGINGSGMYVCSQHLRSRLPPRGNIRPCDVSIARAKKTKPAASNRFMG